MDPVFVLAAPKHNDRSKPASAAQIDRFYEEHGFERLRAVLATPRRIWTMTTEVCRRNGRWRRLLGLATEARIAT